MSVLEGPSRAPLWHSGDTPSENFVKFFTRNSALSEGAGAPVDPSGGPMAR
jgi:hypothetical protein